MTVAVATKYFDTLEYVRKAKEIKDPEALAEYQARQIEAVAEVVAQQAKNEVNHLREEIFSKSLATKSDVDLVRTVLKKEIDLVRTDFRKDLTIEIECLRHETLKFVVWTGVGVTVTLGSILGTMISRI